MDEGKWLRLSYHMYTCLLLCTFPLWLYLFPVPAHIDVYSVAVYLLLLNYSPRLISKHMSVVSFEHVLCLLGKHLALNISYG